MSDEFEEPDEALARNMRRIKTEGLDAATEAALGLLRDPKAPAQAKSATINAMYRAAGLFARPDDEGEIPLHEMTAAQIDRAIRKNETLLRGAVKGRDPEGDVFG